MGDGLRQADALRLAQSALGPGLLNVEAVAAWLGISPRSVRRLVATGAIPPPDFVHGRIVRWRPQSIEAALRQAQR